MAGKPQRSIPCVTEKVQLLLSSGLEVTFLEATPVNHGVSVLSYFESVSIEFTCS